LNWFDRMMEHDRQRRAQWSALPVTSVALFIGSTFFMGATTGAISQLLVPRYSLEFVWYLPLITGIAGAGVAWSGTRGKLWWTFVVVAAFILVMEWVNPSLKGPSRAVLIPQEIRHWVLTSAAVIFVAIGGAWTLAMTFINREGQRFFQVQTEMRLAGEIHQTLVPSIESRIGDYEFYGVSLPSGTVGGDLVDVLDGNGRWLAYVVDVSGHGVSSGVLMAMIKSSVHTALRFQPQLDGLLEEVNRVLCSLKATNMFATCGMIAFSPEHGLRYALAGHLPILHLRGREIDLLREGSLPLGIVPSGKFQAISCELKEGDVLVVLTDGLTEVSGKNGEELGLDWISQALRENGPRPAKEIAAQILAAVQGRGKQSDDQSLLVVRRITELA